jgi:hypothetical protein
MLSGFLISLPGILCLLLAWTGWVMWRRRRMLRRAEAVGSCKLCSTPFAEAQIEWLGPVTRAERAKLDRFQARFAAFTVLCHECGAVNTCTADGIAFTARVPRDD